MMGMMAGKQPGDYVALLDLSTYTTRSDLKLPEGDMELVSRIKTAAVQEDKETLLVVIAACGKEMIYDVKTMAAAM